MKGMSTLQHAFRLLRATFSASFIFLAFTQAFGQIAGNNAVYNSSGSCNSQSKCAGSAAFIDGSVFLGSGQNQGVDLCDIVYKIIKGTITSSYTAGAVIDTRGLTGSALTCTKGSPWLEAGISVTGSSNILLPTGTIVIPSKWVLPPNTHLIGQGDSISSSSTNTVIQVASSFSGDMIDFCSSAPCTAVAVENLVLDGNGNSSVNGIANSNAGSLSYVDHVGLYRILGTGLLVSGSATGSGPYTNINFQTGNTTPPSTTTCVQITGTNGTAGIRGINCSTALKPTGVQDPNAAVLLDSSNNSVKDVTIAGFYDGILVGSNASAQNNILMNIIGDTTIASCLPRCNPIRAVHISNSHSVSDVAIVGLSNEGGATTITLLDDVTGTTLSYASGDTFVGLYALGKGANNGNARFTTSPTVPTWASGTVAPASSSCAQGSLYSCTGSSTACSNTALWGCPVPGGSWRGIE